MSDTENRCAHCGWPLQLLTKDGCTADSCSQRPMPPKRADLEYNLTELEERIRALVKPMSEDERKAAMHREFEKLRRLQDAQELDRLRSEVEALRARVAELEGAGAHDREAPCRGKTPPVAPRDDNDNDNDNEPDIIIAGRRVPFVQVGMIVHPDDCLNCEREGSPLWCSALVCDIHDDDETERFGMMAMLLFRNGERREEPCNELRRRWRLARDFDQTRVYTGRWGAIPRGSVWPVAEVNEEA